MTIRKKLISLGSTVLCALGLLCAPSAKATGACTMLVQAAYSPDDGTSPTVWTLTRNGVQINWIVSTSPITVQDGDIIYLRYGVSSQSGLPWRCLLGTAYDPFTGEIFMPYGLMPAWRFSGYWKVHANCATDDYWLEWWSPQLKGQ